MSQQCWMPTGHSGLLVLRAPGLFVRDHQRRAKRRYLDQAAIAVAPKNAFSLRPEAFRQTVKEGLVAADLFVQLLSDIPGKRPSDLPEGRAKCQLGLALLLGKPVLQWRSTALDMATVKDSIQRALLDAPTVRAEGIEDFKREIRRRLNEHLKPPASPMSIDAFVRAVDYGPQTSVAQRRHQIGDKPLCRFRHCRRNRPPWL
jgi:hypothetical protein